MRGSPYIKPVEGKAKKWEARLQNMASILEEWLTCQKTWLYLEPIFSSDDIVRQMPAETRRFQTVDQVSCVGFISHLPKMGTSFHLHSTTLILSG